MAQMRLIGNANGFGRAVHVVGACASVDMYIHETRRDVSVAGLDDLRFRDRPVSHDRLRRFCRLP